MHMEPARLSLFLCAIQRRLMDTRAFSSLAPFPLSLSFGQLQRVVKLTIRKVCLEQVIISSRNLLHRLGKLQPLLARKLHQRAHMSLRNDEHLKRPDGPPRTDHQEPVVLPNHTLALGHLHLDVVLQQMPPLVRTVVLGHLRQLLARLLGQRARRPDLAVRMRVRAAHGRALVLKDLHVPKLLLFRGLDFAVWVRRNRAERARGGVPERMRGRQVAGIDTRPSLDHGYDLGGAHVRQSGVVLGGEGEHVAPACGGLRLQEERGNVIVAVTGGVLLRVVLLLFLFDGAVVVDEGECVFVMRVGIALGALVTGAEVALGCT